MKVSDAIRSGAEHLSATSETARLDAELLMAHALGVSRSDVLLRQLDGDAPAQFEALIIRRQSREPIAYILGQAEFYGREFAVDPSVLIPRDDSEILIETALAVCPNPSRVLDMGTGSGALLLTILAERPQAMGVGVDASEGAIGTAQSNAQNLDLAERTDLFRRDWNESGWADDLGAFDLILCNPPYVEDDAAIEADVRDYEPASALFAGPQGLDDYRIIIPQLGEVLARDGAAILEIGASQAEMVADIARESGFSTELKNDLGGHDRALVLRFIGSNILG